jgi:hypothetical protein
MKNISTELRTHLDGEVTALATCWVIIRKDGVILRFTDCDDDVVYNGNTYLSIGAYSRTAIESTESLSVDNLEVSGIATTLVLPVEELRAGLYDNAQVRVFMMPWTGVVQGRLLLRSGFFGEVTVLPNGTFTVELRGLMQKLAHTYTEVFSATCRHDLGDSGCTVDISHPFVTEGARIPFPIVDPGFEVAGAGNSVTWYNPTAANDNLYTVSTTYSGTYAARGGTDGGYLVQDVDLAVMGEDFLENIDTGLVALTCTGRRRDNGGQARIRYDFLDYRLRALRTPVYYDSNNGSINIPNAVLNDDFTFEAWVNFQESPGNNARIFYYDDPAESAREMGLQFFDFDGSVRLRIRQPGPAVDPNEIDVEGKIIKDVGVWQHIAVTRAGKVITIYNNGEQVAQGEIEGDVTPFVFDTIGLTSFVAAVDAFWDEIRIWDVARTRAQINQYRFQDLPLATNNLRRYYPFEDGPADAGLDNSGNFTASVAGTYPTNGTPVAVSERGATTAVGTGYENVGTGWVTRTVSGTIPMHTRIVRITFQHLFGSPNPTESLLDTLYGYFTDPFNTAPMPNFAAPGDVWTRAGVATTGGSNRVFQADINETRAITGWFNGGLVTFYSGKNKGASMEVKSYDHISKQVELFLSLPYPIEQGDVFTIYPGCDKSRVCCAVFFDNITNFFGFPDIPGEDELFRYPDAK